MIREKYIKTKLNEAIERYLFDLEKKILPDSRLTEDLGLDSLDLIELAIHLEEKFKIDEIPDEELDNFNTVQDVFEYLDKNGYIDDEDLLLAK